MAAEFMRITQKDFESFLGVNTITGKPLSGTEGFYRIQVPNTVELVYSKFVDTNLTLRIYSSLQPNTTRSNDAVARDKGTDAIRTVIFWRENDKAEPKPIGIEKYVKRITTWRDNLRERVESWDDMLGPNCSCGAPTIRRQRRNAKAGEGYFFGCVKWPNCPADNKDTRQEEVTPEVKEVVKPEVKEVVKPEVEINFSQLFYMLVSGTTDNSIPVVNMVGAANALYGGGFTLTEDGKIVMVEKLRQWLPTKE